MMHTQRFSSLESLQPLRDPWRHLASDAPMISPAWLESWWRAYGSAAGRQLYVVAVFDEQGALAALAPWYVEHSSSQGRVLRLLGSGEVCSDHMSVLCRDDVKSDALDALADWLTEQAPGKRTDSRDDRWDLLELTGIDAADDTIVQLATKMQRRGHGLHHRPALRCWRLSLPETWDEFLAGLSKGHRKQVRRLVRDVFASGRATLHTLDHVEFDGDEQLDEYLDILIDLHQRRRQSIGQPGCFASPEFSRFMRLASGALLREGMLGLHVLRLDGRPIAAEFQLRGGGEILAYQSGIDPDALDVQPGNLSTIATIRQAIDQGYAGLDFLRGDEPYKPHWGAQPIETCELRIVAPHASARLRHAVWAAGVRVRKLVKTGLGRGISETVGVAGG